MYAAGCTAAGQPFDCGVGREKGAGRARGRPGKAWAAQQEAAAGSPSGSGFCPANQAGQGRAGPLPRPRAAWHGGAPRGPRVQRRAGPGRARPGAGGRAATRIPRSSPGLADPAVGLKGRGESALPREFASRRAGGRGTEAHHGGGGGGTSARARDRGGGSTSGIKPEGVLLVAAVHAPLPAPCLSGVRAGSPEASCDSARGGGRSQSPPRGGGAAPNREAAHGASVTKRFPGQQPPARPMILAQGPPSLPEVRLSPSAGVTLWFVRGKRVAGFEDHRDARVERPRAVLPRGG